MKRFNINSSFNKEVYDAVKTGQSIFVDGICSKLYDLEQVHNEKLFIDSFGIVCIGTECKLNGLSYASKIKISEKYLNGKFKNELIEEYDKNKKMQIDYIKRIMIAYKDQILNEVNIVFERANNKLHLASVTIKENGFLLNGDLYEYESLTLESLKILSKSL